LLNPGVVFAVLETARGGILRAGLGFDYCDVAVVTNIGEGDHLGLSDIDTVEKLALVKQTIVEAVPKHGAVVLNATDPLVVAMAESCRGSVVFFAQDADHPVLSEHRAKGGRSVFVRHGEIVLAEGEREIGLARLGDVPLTHGGRIGFQVENTLAAAGAAWAVGIDLDLVRSGLYTFGGEMDMVPGRFNLLQINGSTVILDYGHNPSALLALIDAIEQFPHERKSIVYSAAGDRRDCDFIRQAEILGDTFDRVILYEDHYRRGRAAGEITSIFRKGLSAGERVTEIHDVVGAVKSVEKALKMVKPGELLVIQADVIDETLEFIRRYLASVAEGREIDLAQALEVPSELGVLFAIPEID
jgi:cyanophycin synthetase